VSQRTREEVVGELRAMTLVISSAEAERDRLAEELHALDAATAQVEQRATGDDAGKAAPPPVIVPPPPAVKATPAKVEPVKKPAPAWSYDRQPASGRRF
jgi:hypothetical protein